MGVQAPEVRVVSTQLGVFEVAAGPAGVHRVRLPGAEDSLPVPRAGLDDENVEAARLADRAAAEIAAYFAGELKEFSVPVDLGSIPGFRRRVLEAAGGIPFGETASYREMAIAAGSPGAARAAGSAMGANPVPILIPCHRVIRADGSPGMYGGGEELKRRLLEFEAATTVAV